MSPDVAAPYSPPSEPARAVSTPADEWLSIESLDIEARGVAHNQSGKVVFVEGALPGECVQVDVRRRKNSWEAATLRAIAHESSQRVKPRCGYFGVCGGCAMQHLQVSAQVAIKQRVLEDNLWHLGRLRPDMMLRPIEGPAWGYRWRARLSVRYVPRKQAVLVGFREKKSSYVADMQSCEILPPDVSALLSPLRSLLMSLDGRERIPQIEVAVGADVIVLALRHLEPLTAADRDRLRDFAREPRTGSRPVQWWLQSKGPDTVQRLDREDGTPELSYRLSEFGITMPFKPTDFTQVNPFINQVLVHRALSWLKVSPDDRVIDWFCGLGNFTLPISTQAANVLGLEGSEALVQRSRDNAAVNRRGNVRFEARNLFEIEPEDLAAYGPADKWLVDPPREGAMALAKALASVHAGALQGRDFRPPSRIVYVSCNPATLARDAGILVHQAGYRCSAAGVVNMFPHTGHVESMAVFDFDGHASDVLPGTCEAQDIRPGSRGPIGHGDSTTRVEGQ